MHMISSYIGPQGYIQWAAQGRVPEGLYEESTTVLVNVLNARNFDPEKGFQSNGSQDIGPFNGPLACTEFEKAAYFF